MGFKCGILGLSNVGKSTLFNALTATASAQASSYPFSTIEPNVGEVMVPDRRLDALAKLAKSAKIKLTRLTFVDIAGLVSGASRGEGLGNQFLAHVREVDAIAHVVRCFEDKEIAHVSGAINPIADIDTIETELMLADLDSLERRTEGLAKKTKGNDKDAADAKHSLDRLIRAGYGLLDLITYFTAGPKEAAAWTITRGTKAPQAAAVIHSDFERGFIRAETIAYDDYVTFGGESGARDAGKMRLEGKSYAVADGDVMHFRFAT